MRRMASATSTLQMLAIAHACCPATVALSCFAAVRLGRCPCSKHSTSQMAGCVAAPTLRVFSNWDVMRVIMPRAAMKDRRDSTWVTPFLSMRKRLMLQLPLLMLLSRLAVMTVLAMTLPMSKTAALLALPNALSACTHCSLLAQACCAKLCHAVLCHVISNHASLQTASVLPLKRSSLQCTPASSCLALATRLLVCWEVLLCPNCKAYAIILKCCVVWYASTCRCQYASGPHPSYFNERQQKTWLWLHTNNTTHSPAGPMLEEHCLFLTAIRC